MDRAIKRCMWIGREGIEFGLKGVDDGDLVTSAGISAGIDVSLHVVSRLFGVGLAERTARQMEYDWCDTP